MATSPPGDINVAPTLTVSPTYPGLPSWNDYLRNEVPGAPVFLEPGTPCAGTETGGPGACIHAGELRKVDVTILTSCSGLTMTVHVRRRRHDGGQQRDPAGVRDQRDLVLDSCSALMRSRGPLHANA